MKTDQIETFLSVGTGPAKEIVPVTILFGRPVEVEKLKDMHIEDVEL
jgi:hypothetical protein